MKKEIDMNLSSEQLKELEDIFGMKLASVERILGLPQRYLSSSENLNLPETKAILKCFISMPWLLEIAENNYDPEIARLVVNREATKVAIEKRKIELKKPKQD